MLNQDLMRLLLASLSASLLSYPIRLLPTRIIRQTYSLVVSLLLQIYVYRSSMLIIYLQQLIVFALLRSKISSGALVTAESVVYLAIYHFHEIIYSYGEWTMDASALLMILVCKYSLLAYALEDGRAHPEILTAEQQANRIPEQITLWNFLGYTNFLPTGLLGPPFEFRDYLKFMNLAHPYDHIHSVQKIVAKTAGETVVCAVIYAFGQRFFPISYLKEERFFEMNSALSVLYSLAAVTLVRFKYYFAWKLSMISVHSSGMSFQGNGFTHVNTCNPWVVETSMHVRDKIGNWNIGVQEWLRKCIYERSPFQSKVLKQLYVFMISAFWHGFYLGYYFSFLLWFLQVYFQGLVFKYSQRPDTLMARMYLRLGPARSWILALLATSFFTHNATFFLILEGSLCARFLLKIYCIPQLVFIALIIIFFLLLKNNPRNKLQ